jgi:hypothetical protein
MSIRNAARERASIPLTLRREVARIGVAHLTLTNTHAINGTATAMAASNASRIWLSATSINGNTSQVHATDQSTAQAVRSPANHHQGRGLAGQTS